MAAGRDRLSIGPTSREGRKMSKLCCGAVAVALLSLGAGAVQASNGLSGTVSGPNGPEAGVWVIAETRDTPTKFARIVVTDDKGRYLVPDLPKGEYEVWVRGYGLVDSPKVKASPGENLDLTAVPATNEREAAQYFPSRYRFSLGEPPREDTSGLGEDGFVAPAQLTGEAEKGEAALVRPERPKGAARNLVVTTWDWSEPRYALRELASTDRRNPRLNAHGRVYGSTADSTDLVPILDPKTNSSSVMVHPVREPKSWGEMVDGRTLNQSPMVDEKRRVWFAARIASGSNPEFCKSGSSHLSARAFPLQGEAGRHLSMFDPKKGEWKLVRTCFPTHDLSLSFDEDNTIWVSSGAGEAPVLGWFNRYVYERTGDEAIAQGWTPFVLDTSGDGKRGAYVEPGEPLAPRKDQRIAVSLHSIAVSPLDGAVWGTAAGFPGGIVRVAPGGNPAQTALAEYYEVPLPGYGPRGGDVDTNGVYWVALASGHLGRFVRSSCKVLNGPKATGKHCPEGWTFYELPGPQARDAKMPASAESSYRAWVDWFGILGLGKNVPIALGKGADAVHALVKGEFVTLHIPHPMGVFPKNLDGRIDDESGGWKGRGLWTTSGVNAERPKVVKLQMRPHPLAK
jgi:hypothetical protein